MAARFVKFALTVVAAVCCASLMFCGAALAADAVKVKISVGGREFTAIFEGNAASRALVQKMPFTVRMDDLYGREMCYRMGAGALPEGTLRSDRYEVGDIVYWPPRGSLVILYEQNGEQFARQQIGYIAEGVEFFKTTGDIDVTFEVVSE